MKPGPADPFPSEPARPSALVFWAVLGAYALGVLNEVLYPGDRWLPSSTGEAVIWFAVLVLAVLSSKEATR